MSDKRSARAAELTLEFIFALASPGGLTLTDSNRVHQADRDTWRVTFSWRGREHNAELDLEAGKLLIDWGLSNVRATLTEDGYRVGSESFDSPEDAAARLVEKLEAYVEE